MKKTVRTGTLTLDVAENNTGLAEHDIFDLAARQNPKRGFLIVSKLLGRHMPTRPAVMREVMTALGRSVPADLAGPVLFVGMAETAVGLGQGVHAAWRDATGRKDAHFIQSTRQTHPQMPVWTTFEEGHSHASSHLVHVPVGFDVAGVRSVVIIDDECSTGATFIQVEGALRRVMPALERVVDVVITEWSQDPARERIALVRGAMTWEPAADGSNERVPGENANRHGETSPGASAGRQGYTDPPLLPDGVPELLPHVARGERIVVLADGENAYDALLVGEELERRGAVVALQSITRSPAHVGGAMSSRALFSDAHGSGATCYSYNLSLHRPTRYVVVVERDAGQAQQVESHTGLPAIAVRIQRGKA